MPKVWLIRNDELDEELETGGFVSIGWDHIPDLASIDLSTEALASALKEEDPDASPGRLSAHAGTLRRFYEEVSEGDVVVAPRHGTNLLRVGVIDGPYFHAPQESTHHHRIPVRWAITALRRDLLPEAIRNGLRNISTLSEVRRQPEFFVRLSQDPTLAEEIDPREHSGPQTWLVGASINGEDQTDSFLASGIWHLADGLDARTDAMRAGDRIAIKSSYVRKHDLPFENRGLNVSCMMIKARGTITQITTNQVNVDWDDSFEPREWYFYTFMTAVQRLNPEHRHTKDLERFIFDGEDQDIQKFLSDPFWARYTEADVGPITSSFRVARPSVQPVYEAMERWRDALITGTSLFSGEPLNYREATAELINDFVEQPMVGEGNFTGKLKTQLETSADSALQLAAELLFIYCLPMHQGSMGQSAKVDLIGTVTDWRGGVAPLPEELERALTTGVARVGTAYHTYRWKVFGYLVLLTHALASLPTEERRTALSSLTDFRSHIQDVDDQSVWSMRFLLEHLLFPDEAVNASSREDRIAMVAAFSGDARSGEVNPITATLPANIRYGDKWEINPYAAPHRYDWADLGEEARVWGEWAALLLSDTDDSNGNLTTRPPLEPRTLLKLLDSGAARKLSDWLATNPDEIERFVEAVTTHGLARAVDSLSEAVNWAGDPAEFAAAATTALGASADAVPQLDEHLIPVLLGQLGNVGIAPAPTPGEVTLATLEALDTFGVAVSRESGVELQRAALASLAQRLHDLDPAATAWTIATQERFLDWRSGRGLYGPAGLDEPPAPPEDASTPTTSETAVELEPEDVPQSLEELSRNLTFDTEQGRKWLETTRTLLHDRGQIILQGPPGTGKTFVAQKLALFLAGHSSRVRVVQFHPATAYEDFIEGLRPKTDGSGGFEVRPGPLLQLAEQARKNPNRQHILIIDEINRANLPAVFGELYFLLEYRDTEMQLTSGGRFRLPENLLIIGTMNTADRSIASIDAALRRRFYIHDLRPEEAPLNEVLGRWLTKQESDLTWLPALLSTANDQIGDEDQHIGPSHFLKRALTEERARHAWQHTVLPTLREHFYGQTDRIDEFDFDALKSRVLNRDVTPD